jgi:hypothetical protein
MTQETINNTTCYGNVVYDEKEGFYAELWIGSNIFLSYPLCKRDLEFVKTLDNERFSTLTEVEFKIIDGEAVMQEPEDDREPNDICYE